MTCFKTYLMGSFIHSALIKENENFKNILSIKYSRDTVYHYRLFDDQKYADQFFLV